MIVMSLDTPIQPDPYLSSKEAGKLLGYTHDYISKLCREGKMVGIQRGRVWFVTEAEVRAFQVRHEAELEQKKAELSEKFSEIRMKHESSRKSGMTTTTEPPAEIFSVSIPVQKGADPYILGDQPVLTPAVDQVSQGQDDAPVQKTLQFAMPKHFVAAAVLALFLLLPSFLRSVDTEMLTSLNLRDFSASDIVLNIDTGIATVIGAQSELVTQTANTFSFMQYLGDGYWELAVSTIQMCQNFYEFLTLISNAYISVYVLHGQIVYDSFSKIDNMGATVLMGYELVGQSFVAGSHNVIDMLKGVFMVDYYVETLKKN